MIIIKIHSVVDVITNSSTVIYTYQNSIKETKGLVEEILKIANITDKTPDDIFYYGVFCDNERYLESDDSPGDFSYNDEEKLNALKLSIMKGELEHPEWMNWVEDGDGDSWAPDSYLHLIVKDERFQGIADEIKRLLNSIGADGGSDG